MVNVIEYADVTAIIHFVGKSQVVEEEEVEGTAASSRKIAVEYCCSGGVSLVVHQTEPETLLLSQS